MATGKEEIRVAEPPIILFRERTKPIEQNEKQGKGRTKVIKLYDSAGNPLPKRKSEAEWRIEAYTQNKDTFTEIRAGSSVRINLKLHKKTDDGKDKWHHKIYYQNDNIFIKDATPEQIKQMMESKKDGFHICQMVERDVKRWIANHPEVNYLDLLPFDPSMQIINPTALINAEAKKFNPKHKIAMAAIDMKDCFFTTAMNMGFITYRTAEMSHKPGKNWKFGRNASIGRFATTKYKTEVVDGIRGETEVIPPQNDLKWVRQQILIRVQQIAFEIAELIGEENFYFWLTDCAFINPKYAGLVKEYYNYQNYAYTPEVYDLIHFQHKDKANTITNKVYWRHPTRSDEDPKFYFFGNRLNFADVKLKNKQSQGYDFHRIMNEVNYAAP